MNQPRRMNQALYVPALIAGGVVLALLMVAGIWGLVIAIPIGIAMVAIAFFRARRTGGAAEIGVERMRTERKSRWKGLLLFIGVCVATLVGMSAYAFSLEEWGAVRTMIFNLGGMLVIGAALVALVLLISDLMGSARRRIDS